MIEYIAEEVNATGFDREDLVVWLYLKLKIVPEIFPDIRQQSMEAFFVWGEEDQVVCIPEIISDTLCLFEPMIKSAQVEVGEILG